MGDERGPVSRRQLMADNKIKVEFVRREDHVALDLDGQRQEVEVEKVFQRWERVWLHVAGRAEPIGFARGDRVELIQQQTPASISPSGWSIGQFRADIAS